MKLVFLDPNNEGIQITGCDSRTTIDKTLSRRGINAKTCAGKTVPFIFIDRDGNEHKGELSFT